MTPQQTALIASLRGAPASILWALVIAQTALGAAELATSTTWSPDQVTAGLKRLAALGLVQKHGRYNSWQLTAQVKQLMLDLTWLEAGSPLPAESSASATTESFKNLLELNAVVVGTGSPLQADSHISLQPPSQAQEELHSTTGLTPRQQATFDNLLNRKVYEPSRSIIVQRGVTAKMIDAQARQLERRCKYSIPLLIHALASLTPADIAAAAASEHLDWQGYCEECGLYHCPGHEDDES